MGQGSGYPFTPLDVIHTGAAQPVSAQCARYIHKETFTHGNIHMETFTHGDIHTRRRDSAAASPVVGVRTFCTPRDWRPLEMLFCSRL